MPKKPTANKPKRETWRDWQPANAPDPGQLISRDDLIQALQQEQINATERDLLYWQKVGLIPYPIIRRAGRAGYAAYPFWMIELIRALRSMQADGKSADEIRAALRRLAHDVFVLEEWRPTIPAAALTAQLHKIAATYGHTYQRVTAEQLARSVGIGRCGRCVLS